MHNLKLIILMTGCVFILFGYLCFITDEKGNVNLNNYRFTGGLLLVVSGMIDGTQDLINRLRSKNSLSAIAIYLGILLFYIGFSI
ncbi:hypothetical protein PESP_b0715 [Pseudoalteromonas espejiana DSM 9414]|uniref:MetJ regulator of methionine regulon n=1 Tax=Pseudoalteromonas espejiana TaxID=28107 RepID=A0A510XRJ3_9GAMM|nr:MetJ regulator of methionine regulon [Pseudoalteromonas espejiana]ASM52238.1 hypothetical protein PESP_b0715 [Pseudoalteromonas espejiana DSM 9414]GEK53654.1 hypothetical protein PES01_04990 [Pseudoalteromonas espejiana]